MGFTEGRAVRSLIFAIFFVFSSELIASGGVYLGASRIIFDSDREIVPLKVKNSEKNKVWLIRSWLVGENEKKKSSEFIITPPLRLLEGEGEVTLRINAIDKEKLPKDRESLFYINVMQIPNKDSEKKANVIGGSIQFSITHVIKMFYRPKEIINDTKYNHYPDLYIFDYNGDKYLKNSSPFYVSLSTVKVNDEDIHLENMLIKPLDGKLKLPRSYEYNDAKISYEYIDDLGSIRKVDMVGKLK